MIVPEPRRRLRVPHPGPSPALVALLVLVGSDPCAARKPIRDAFFDHYPDASGSAVDSLPSNATHCGACHYDFNGGGPRNPYGVSLEAMAQANGLDVASKRDRPQIVALADPLDPDGDGLTTGQELDATGHANGATFPGWSEVYVDRVVHVLQSEVEAYLTPVAALEGDPPSVTLLSPNGGSPDVTAGMPTNVTWIASDPSGIAAVHLYLSLDGGASVRPIELGLPNSGSYSWIPANRPSTAARLRVVAVDGAGNLGEDTSDAVFSIVPPAGGLVPTTLRDFDMPGSQPFESGVVLADAGYCASCHGDYEPTVEPHANWQGSIMAHASIDPLFKANLAIANQDAPESGDLCLRCHNPRGWLQGRSVPTDGSRMEPADLAGVSCDLCHRMVDPVFEPSVSPSRDEEILAALGFPGTETGNGMMVVDPASYPRGPFGDAESPHHFVPSAFHADSAFCGTCHDVSNPAFTRDAQGVYQPNAFDESADDFSPHAIAPVERTYSEWLNSAYAASGVAQPEFAGNKPGGVVSSCQDCHMRDVTGAGCNVQGAPVRDDLPLHDMTGGSTWLPGLLPDLHPERFDDAATAAVEAGIDRAAYMLEHAATLGVAAEGGQLVVTVTNQTGHKLPTGYPEGRRIWINVRFFDAADQLLAESGAYDPGSGELSHGPETKVYEVHPGIGDNIDEVVGLPVGPSLHFVLNNRVFDDNRIPPRGFTNAAFQAFGGAPVGHAYADGQYWDDTSYTVPVGTARAEVRLYYQSTSKEFVEFLRDENQAPTPNAGTVMYDLWDANGKCPPVLMEEAAWTAPTLAFGGIESATPGIESAALGWSAATSSHPPVTYAVYHSLEPAGQDFATPLLTTTGLSEVVALDPGSTAALTHYFVVRATDDGGGSEGNAVELAVQPLLDPAKDQDADGLRNDYELAHACDPFDPTDSLADPDGDALTTLEECAYGSDPHDASSAHRPRAIRIEDGGETYFAVRFVRSEAAGTPTVTAEVSVALETWDGGPALTTELPAASNGDGTETVIIRLNESLTGTAYEFIRLRVSAP